MTDTTTIKVPDIGDFSDVPVIEVLVSPGDTVDKEQTLLTLESDKATLDIPAPQAGKITKVLVAEGDRVGEGTAILEMEAASSPAAGGKEAESGSSSTEKAPSESKAKAADTPADSAPETRQEHKQDTSAENYDTELVVIGSGPGGYTAAFRAADLGVKTTLIERYDSLGGVCLNVGCIPSKALLHTAEVINSAADMAAHGVTFGEPSIDVEKLNGWKESVVGKLTGGLAQMAKKRGVKVVKGSAEFTGPHELSIKNEDETTRLTFAKAIIAVGSQAFKLPGLPWDDPRLMDSTDALDIHDIPGTLLVVGGGIIGMEMASVYHGLGTKVTVCELMDQLMPGADADLVKPFHRYVAKRYEKIMLKTKVSQIDASDSGLTAHFEGDQASEPTRFDRILIAVGRSPNGNTIHADAAGVEVTERGFIETDHQMRTNVDHIFAIGDVVGQPMLAHKATHEAKVAAEVCAGEKAAFEARVIPSVAYTDPEVSWVGLTEIEAKEKGIDYEVGKFPWAASGRALGLDRPEGFTKLLFDPATDRLLGAGIVGPHAGDLIAECALAIEMGADAADIGMTIHPHPTLSETVAFAAEAFEGTITDLYLPKKKKTG